MQFKINIIDDEKNLNDLVRTYLEKEGYIVYSFYTYDEALMHKNDDVHLWLIDIMLDRSSGFELFNEIKNLTTKEYDLLVYFITNKGLAISREQVLNKVWDENYYGSDRVVDDTLRRLRKKMPEINIRTIYGFGYRLD